MATASWSASPLEHMAHDSAQPFWQICRTKLTLERDKSPELTKRGEVTRKLRHAVRQSTDPQPLLSATG